MCTGVEIAALAATAAGSYMQYDSQQSKADAQREAANAEALRQGAIDKNKNERWQNSLVDFGRESQEGNLEDATSEREQLMKDVVARPEDGDGTFQAATSANAPRVVQDYADKKQGEADDFVDLLGNARARLGAWGEGKFAPAESLSQLGFDLSEYNTQAGRSASIGANEAKQAYADTGNGVALAGNLLSSAGTAGMGYAGSQRAAGQGGKLFANDYGMSSLGRNFYGGTGGSY